MSGKYKLITEDPALHAITIGNTKITHEELEELMSIRDFLNSLSPRDTELGRLWVAYKARKRIME